MSEVESRRLGTGETRCIPLCTLGYSSSVKLVGSCFSHHFCPLEIFKGEGFQMRSLGGLKQCSFMDSSDLYQLKTWQLAFSVYLKVNSLSFILFLLVEALVDNIKENLLLIRGFNIVIISNVTSQAKPSLVLRNLKLILLSASLESLK